MGKTWFGYDNIAHYTDMQFSTSSESAAYPVSNLNKTRLRPGWRSDRKPLYFDGDNDYLYAAHHADFDITDNLVVYSTFVIGANAIGTARTLLAKWDSSNQAGFLLFFNGSKLVFRVGDGFGNWAEWMTQVVEVDNVFSAICSWDSINECQICLNGENLALQEVIGGGTKPSSIGVNSKSMYVGRLSNADAWHWQGYVQECGIANSEVSTWHWPYSANGYYTGGLVSYWWLDQWNGSTVVDQHGGHDLQAVNLDSTDTVPMKGSGLVCLDIALADNVHRSVEMLVVDRRHNLSDSCDLQIGRLAYFSNSNQKSLQQISIESGKAIVGDFQATGNTNRWWFQVFDNETGGGGYYDIPLVYFGQKAELQRSMLTGFEQEMRTAGSNASSPSGSRSTFSLGEEHYAFRVSFRCDTFDKEILKEVIRASAKGYPVVFCPDSDKPEETWFVLVEDPFNVSFKQIVGDHYAVDLTLIEVT